MAEGDAEQGLQVDEILGPFGVVTGQHLEGDQVSVVATGTERPGSSSMT